MTTARHRAADVSPFAGRGSARHACRRWAASLGPTGPICATHHHDGWKISPTRNTDYAGRTTDTQAPIDEMPSLSPRHGRSSGRGTPTRTRASRRRPHPHGRMCRGAGASRSRTPGQSPAAFFDDRRRSAIIRLLRARAAPAEKEKNGATHCTPRRSRKTQRAGRGGGRACAPAAVALFRLGRRAGRLIPPRAAGLTIAIRPFAAPGQ